MFWWRSFVFFFVAFDIFQAVKSDGKVKIMLIKLHNPQHLENGEECCDIWPFRFCRGECDTKLDFCVTGFQQLSSRVSCNIGKGETKIYKGMSTVNFKAGENLGNGFKNPLIFKFKQWEKYLEVMFVSYDDDKWPMKDDLIDTYSDIFSIEPAVNSTMAEEKLVTVRGRVSTMEFKVKVYCDDDSSRTGNKC